MKTAENKKLIGIAAASLALILSACGGSPAREVVGVVPQPQLPGGGSGGDTIQDSFQPSWTSDFGVSGQLGPKPKYTTEDLYTDSILKVKITAAPGSLLADPQGSNFSAEYGCAQFTVTVNGRSVTTQILKVEGSNSWLCANAPTSQTLDFSDRLGGAGPVQVEVTNGKYDFYCQMHWDQRNKYGYSEWDLAGWAAPCPLKSAFKNHMVNGQVAIQLNGYANP